MKERREYKIGRRSEWGEIRELREKHCHNKNGACNQLQEIYTRTILLGLCQKQFYLNKVNLSLLYSNLNPL